MLEPPVLSAAASILMALIWIVYLHLAMSQYRRSQRPLLLIHHAHEGNPDALCLFVNMSQEPVHLQCVIALLHGPNGTTQRWVTQFDRITPEECDVKSKLRQGPIQPGGYLVLGSFREIILGRQSDDDDEAPKMLSEIDRLELGVAVIHGPSRYHIGARRSFFIECGEDGQFILRAHSIYTEQLVRRRRQQATVQCWIEGRIEPRYRGAEESETVNQGPNGGEEANGRAAHPPR